MSDFTDMAHNGPALLNEAMSLTVEDLIRMMPEIEAKFPKDDFPPNPADVHPATFSALMNVCDAWTEPPAGFGGLGAITLHVRTDVDPWKLHPCKCVRALEGKHDAKAD